MADNIIQYLQHYPAREVILFIKNGDQVQGMLLEANIDIVRIQILDGRTDHVRPEDICHFLLVKV